MTFYPFVLSSGSGTVTSVGAADTSIVISGTPTVAPLVATGTLDVIAAQHPPAAAVAMNSQKITGLANGTAAADGTAFGQTPAGGTTVTLAQGGTGQIWQPSDHGLTAWAFDPVLITAGFLAIGGTVYLIGVRLRVTTTVTNVCAVVTAAGVTLTANENFGGLYNSAGTLLSATADQSSLWTSAGTKTMALAAQQVNLAAGLYWVALVANGTTEPTFARGSNFSASANNFGLSAANSRYGTGGTAQTSLPASITPSAIVQTANVIWAGVS